MNGNQNRGNAKYIYRSQTYEINCGRDREIIVGKKDLVKGQMIQGSSLSSSYWWIYRRFDAVRKRGRTK